MTKRANTDLISGVIGLLIMGFFWFSRGGVTRLSIMFPNALLILMAIFSVALIIKGLVKPEKRDLFTEGSRWRIAVTAIMLFAWLFAVVYIGFYVGSVAIFTLMTVYLAAAHHKITLRKVAFWLVIIAIQVAVLYGVFVKFLYVPLPKGLLF